jgi:hypothetical protein
MPRLAGHFPEPVSASVVFASSTCHGVLAAYARRGGRRRRVMLETFAFNARSDVVAIRVTADQCFVMLSRLCFVVATVDHRVTSRVTKADSTVSLDALSLKKN